MNLESDVLKIVKVQNGTNGNNGVGISSTIITYGVSSSDTIEPSTYNPAFPSNIQQGQWIWTKTIINYTDATSKTTYSKTYIGQDGSQGQPGTPGVGISSTVIKYGKSDSENTEPSNWYDSTAQIIPAPVQGDWLWVRAVINYTNGNSSTSYSKSYIGTDGQDGTSVSIQSTSKTGKTTTIIINNGDGTTQTLTIDDGEDGENGTPGANGYVHVAWANSADGSQDFSTSVSANKEYIGVYTDNIEQDSQHYYDYSWSLIKGADGADGKGIVSIVEYYARNNNKNSAPDTGWGTAILTPTVDQQYVWNYETINYSVGSPTNTEKHIVAMYGRGIQSIVDKYATSVDTSTPLDSSFNTTIPSDWGPNKKYLWNMETITYTDGNSSNSSKRIISIYAVDGTSVTITGTSTSGGITTITFSDGTSIQISDGKEISTITEYYAISNNSATAPSTGWNTTLQTPTSANPYLWNYERITYSNNTTTDTSKRIIGTFSKGITSITNYYAKTQNTTAPQSTSTDWIACPPGIIPTLDSTYKYLWNYERTVYNDSTFSDTTAHIISMYAQDGAVVTVTNTTITYCQSTNGTTRPTSDWQPNPPTAIAGQYMWTKTVITYSDNSSSTTYSVSKNGTNGQNGTNGIDGNNYIILYYYKRTTDATVPAPSGNYTYNFNTNTISSEPQGWRTSFPTGNDPCWVTAISFYGTGTTVSGTFTTPVKLVENGEDAGQYQIHFNQQRILKYLKEESTHDNIQYEISPDILKISLYDFKNSNFLDININNLDLNISIDDNEYSIKSLDNTNNKYWWIDNNNKICNLNLTNLYELSITTEDISEINPNLINSLRNFFLLLQGNIHVVATINNQKAEKYINILNGLSDEMLRFSVEARKIQALVDNTKLEFTTDGLILTNGSFTIYDTLINDEDKRLFSVDLNQHELYMRGNGSFTGTITANSGQIGGFSIGSNTISSGDNLILTSSHYDEQHNFIESSIKVQNIEIGTGARITDFLQIGNLKLLNPEKNNNFVIKLDNNNETKFSLKNNGELVATGANITGIINAQDGYFSGEINASTINACTINTANFIAEETRTMGGSFVYRPAFDVVNVEEGSNTTPRTKIKITLNNNVRDYAQSYETEKDRIISLSGKEIYYGKLVDDSNWTENTIYGEFTTNDHDTILNSDEINTITFFGYGNYTDLLIGINSDNNPVGNIMPPRALVMESFSNLNTTGTSGTIAYNIRLLLGDLSSISNRIGENPGYGLYADNVYLTGSLTTGSGDNYNSNYAGINTRGPIEFNYITWGGEREGTDYSNDKIIFWGGANTTAAGEIQRAPFIVTDKGNIFARNGEFKGAVIANSIISDSTLKAAIIEGNGTNGPSLKIYNTDEGQGEDLSGIGFYKKSNSNDPDELTLLINTSGLYYKNNTKNFISFDSSNNKVNANLDSTNYGNIKINNTGIISEESDILIRSRLIQTIYNSSGIINDANNNGLIENKGNVTFSNGNNKLEYVFKNNYHMLYVKRG